jgi:hypothetical protein
MLVVVGPPRIHRITSSPARPSLLYERIGDPSLGIFKMRLPESMVDGLDAIIAHAEEYMTTTRHGSWKTGLYSLTRQDVAMRQIPGMKARIDPIVDYLTRTMEALYGCRRVLMDRNQPHILKYSIDSGHTGGRYWQVGDVVLILGVSLTFGVLLFFCALLLQLFLFFESNFIMIDATLLRIWSFPRVMNTRAVGTSLLVKDWTG